MALSIDIHKLGSPGLCDFKVVDRGVSEEDPLSFYFGDLEQRVEIKSEDRFVWRGVRETTTVYALGAHRYQVINIRWFLKM